MRSLALLPIASLLVAGAACKDTPGKASVEAYDDYMSKSKRVEAELNLDRIQKSLKAYAAEYMLFPSGAAPLTPSTACCEGPNQKCEARGADWIGTPVWEAVNFELVEPSRFQYSYESTDGKVAVVRAVGDLDCDRTTITYELRCEFVEGNALCSITPPAGSD